MYATEATTGFEQEENYEEFPMVFGCVHMVIKSVKQIIWKLLSTRGKRMIKNFLPFFFCMK